MKTKDIIYMLLAVGIFLVAGYIAYTQLFAPKQSAKKKVEVEVVGEIKPDFSGTALAAIKNSDKNRDFSVPLDLTTGLNNTAIFGR
jgi:PBP1b-binding outer membrane lipoprotein LpoB